MAKLDMDEVLKGVLKTDVEGFTQTLIGLGRQFMAVAEDLRKDGVPTDEEQERANEFLNLALFGKLVEDGVVRTAFV